MFHLYRPEQDSSTCNGGDDCIPIKPQQQHQLYLPQRTTSSSSSCLRRFLQFHLPKLVLEVFGSTGAIWGFSEALGLRTMANNWFWRPIALMVGILFFSRWFHQVRRTIARSSSCCSSSTDSENNSILDMEEQQQQQLDETSSLVYGAGCRYFATPAKSRDACSSPVGTIVTAQTMTPFGSPLQLSYSLDETRQ